jgi:hypothetical protein
MTDHKPLADRLEDAEGKFDVIDTTPVIKVPKFATERKFSAWFTKQLRKQFGEKMVIVNVTGSGYGTSGVSDLILCFYGIFFACELKMDGKGLTKLQLRFCMNVDRAGGRTLSPVTPSRALQAIDYFKTIEQFRSAKVITQSLTPDEAQEVVDEVKETIAAEGGDLESSGFVKPSGYDD